MGTLVEETKEVDMEMPEEKEKKEKKEKKKQTNSVSSKPQKRISRPKPSEAELLDFEEDLRESIALRAARKKVHPNVVQTVRRPRPKPSEAELLDFKEDLSLEPISIIPIHHRARRPRHLGEKTCHVVIESSESPSVSVKSDSSMNNPPSVDPQKTQSASLPSSVSVKNGSSMLEPPGLNLQKTQSESLCETDSTDSSVSVKSASSMAEPFSFNRSCAVCEEAVKDPVRLLCGHWSCKECSHSFWDECGDSDPCKKCGERSEREKRDQDLRSVLLEKKIKRVEMETEKLQAEKEKLQAEKETFQAEKEKFQAEKEKLQAEKEKLQAEKEKLQPEKEKLQAEKEKIELEKRKLALEIQLLALKGSYTNNDQGVVIPKTRMPYI